MEGSSINLYNMFLAVNMRNHSSFSQKSINNITNKKKSWKLQSGLNKSSSRNDSTFPVRTYHQVAQRDMWRIFNMKVINLFTWRGAKSRASPKDRPATSLISTTAVEISRLEDARGAAEDKCEWLIKMRRTEMPPSVSPTHWFRPFLSSDSRPHDLLAAVQRSPSEDGVRGKEEEKEVTEL